MHMEFTEKFTESHFFFNICVAKKSSSCRAGYLSLLVNQVWRQQWCSVYKGSLHFYHEKGEPRTSWPSLPLHCCEVVPGLGPKHPFAFRILQNSTEVAALEVRCTLKGRWIDRWINGWMDFSNHLKVWVSYGRCQTLVWAPNFQCILIHSKTHNIVKS